MEFQMSKSVRIRLFFEEQSMLSKVQADQGLAKSWYLVDTNVLLSIANLATRIALDYNLGQSCPHGISLEICGFVLPPSQSTRLLQDSDLVSVRRSQDGVSGGHSRELLTNSLSVDDEELRIGTRYNKVGLRALEEFEKEAGGYESEYSEDKDPKVYLGVGNDLESAETAKRMSKLKDSNGKKRKRSSNIDTLQSKMLVTSPGYASRAAGRDLEGSDIQNRKSTKKEKIKKGTECILEDGDGIGPSRGEKKKKKRKLVEKTSANVKSSEDSEGRTSNAQEQRSGKKRSRKHKTDLEQVSLKPMEEEKTPCRSKRGENLSVLNGGTGIIAEAIHDRKKSKKPKDKNPVEVDEQEVQPKKKSSDKNNSNDGNAPAVTEQTNSEEKRPSRSARRKKAKRRWIREQAQNGTLPKKEDVKENRKEEPNAESDTSEEVAVAVAVAVAVEAEVEAEEVEAEEEILPVMVAPGHIRFEPDEDVGDQDQHAMPVLQLSANIRCKRQGQAWGQEKSYYDNHHESSGYGRSHEKREKKHLEQLAEEEMPAGDKIVIDVTEYEKFPVLNRVPQVGDVLAYKLVELTASWTPELSAYRVGKVSVYIETTRVITLVPVPEYPIHVRQPEDYDMDAQQDDDDSFLPPYNPDGTLEVDLAALMEVRVLEHGPQSGAVAVQAQEAQKQELPNIGASTVNEGLLNSTNPVILQRETQQEDVEIAVAVQEASLTSEDLPQNDHAGIRSRQQTVAEGAESTLTIGLVESLEPTCDTAWQEILSQDLIKRKLELAAKFSKQLSGGEGAEPAGTPTTTSKPEALSTQDTKTGPGKKGIPQIRHRHMRTGALGPTMAMLRASQVL